MSSFLNPLSVQTFLKFLHFFPVSVQRIPKDGICFTIWWISPRTSQEQTPQNRTKTQNPFLKKEKQWFYFRNDKTIKGSI